MNTETDYLTRIADEITAHKDEKENNTKPDPHLLAEAKRLENDIIQQRIAMGNFTQHDNYHLITLRKLVRICDGLYDNTGSINPNVNVVMDLLTATSQVIPQELRPNLKLPKAFITKRMEEMEARWLHHSGLMVQHNVPEKLIIIAGIPFKRFTEPKLPIFWGDYTWLKDYQSKLDILDWENADCNSPAEALTSLLIGRDFNDDRFFIYCKKYITERLKKITGKRNRVLELAQCEKLVLEDTQVGVQPFDRRANSVSARLTKWIREEIDFVETHERDRPFAKFEFKWNVEMIAFFFKLLHERGVFGKIPLEPFAETIASNCSSVGKEDFQPATIQSRFYMKDLEVIKAIEKLLLELLEIIRKYLR